MIVLDTDHLVELDHLSAPGAALQRKLEDADDEIATTIISAEEQFRGWLAQIHRLVICWENRSLLRHLHTVPRRLLEQLALESPDPVLTPAPSSRRACQLHGSRR